MPATDWLFVVALAVLWAGLWVAGERGRTGKSGSEAANELNLNSSAQLLEHSRIER